MFTQLIEMLLFNLICLFIINQKLTSKCLAWKCWTLLPHSLSGLSFQERSPLRFGKSEWFKYISPNMFLNIFHISVAILFVRKYNHTHIYISYLTFLFNFSSLLRVFSTKKTKNTLCLFWLKAMRVGQP